MRLVLVLATVIAAAAMAPACAVAHGFAGKRFFPATIATDDPFVADELSMPTVSMVPNSVSGGEPPTRETDVGIDVSKRITSDFGIGLDETWQHFDPKGASSFSGFGNLGVSAKYLVLENDPHEFLFSVGLDAEVGGTGDKRIGADDFSTLAPAIFLGKGFGDLSDSMALLKPLAVTGVVGLDIPTEARSVNDTGDVERHPHVLNTGIAIEYSLPYLQASVRDIGLGAPFGRLIPLVEVNLQTPIDRGSSGKTVGTVNPGLIWAGQYMQIGLEAVIPVNERSGDGPGVVAQLHFFLDDIFPESLGRPIFKGMR